MSEKGITNAAALVGGTQVWENAGYPMESKSGKSGSANQNKQPDGGNAPASPTKNENKKP